MSQPRPWIAALVVAGGIAMASHAAAATPQDEERAAELFDQSAEHYRAGRFEQAVRLLREAHDLVGEPVLLYNLARAHEGHGDLADAIAAYRRYLAESDEVEDRGAIERRIATLEDQLAERRALARDAEAARRRAAEAEAGRERPSASPYPWIVVGVGGATLAVSAVLGALAESRQSQAEEEIRQVPAADALDEAQTFATATNVTLALGGAVLVGGLAWGVADLLLLEDDGDDVALRLRLAAGRAALGLTFP